jgi:hypothetical protein
MSDPVVRTDWKRRAIRAEMECEDLRTKLYHYASAAAVTAIVAVATLLFALLK